MAANREVVVRFYRELWNAWRLELVDEIVAPEVRFRGSLGQTCEGRAQFRSYVEDVRRAFPDWHNSIDELIPCADRVVVRLTCTGTHLGRLGQLEATGARVSYVAVAILAITGGQIREGWVVGDTQELWRSIGKLR